jgi:hypothetical protein
MAKNDSDVFICKPEGGDYWAYPSPFVAHRRGAQIQFRNLTGDTIEIDFGKAPVHKKSLKLAPGKKGVVTVNVNAPPGLHQYRAEVKLAEVPPAPGGKGLRKSDEAPTTRKPEPIFVRGGSPPQIIIDT